MLTDHANIIPTVEATYNEIMAFGMTVSEINEIECEDLSSKSWEQHALKLNLQKLVFLKINIQHLGEKIQDERDFIMEIVQSVADCAHYTGFSKGAELGMAALPPKYDVTAQRKENISNRFNVLAGWERMKGVYLAEHDDVWKNYKHYFVQHFSYTIGNVQDKYYAHIGELEPYFKAVFDFAFDKGLHITKDVAISGLYSQKLAVWYPAEWIYG